MGRRFSIFIVLMAGFLWPAVADSQDGRAPVDIFLDDEQLDVEADIPAVDLVLNFKGLRYETLESKQSFLPELLESVEESPF